MTKRQKELKKAIISWIFENENTWQITNECKKAFRNYIYDNSGNYIIGGEDVLEFINEAIDLILNREV